MSARVAIKPTGSKGGRPSREQQEKRNARASKDSPVAANKNMSSLTRKKSMRPSKEEAKWQVEQKWAPPRPLTEQELTAARKLFFELDTDGSGSIDIDELGAMMRRLGQNPTEKELQDLIKSVDDEGDGDGKIQLREFLTLYTRGLDTKNKPGMHDVNNIFAAMGGDVRDKGSTVGHDHMKAMLLNDYGLDVDFGQTFGVPKPDLNKEDFETILLAQQTGGRPQGLPGL